MESKGRISHARAPMEVELFILCYAQRFPLYGDTDDGDPACLWFALTLFAMLFFCCLFFGPLERSIISCSL